MIQVRLDSFPKCLSSCRCDQAGCEGPEAGQGQEARGGGWASRRELPACPPECGPSLRPPGGDSALGKGGRPASAWAGECRRDGRGAGVFPRKAWAPCSWFLDHLGKRWGPQAERHEASAATRQSRDKAGRWATGARTIHGGALGPRACGRWGALGRPLVPTGRPGGAAALSPEKGVSAPPWRWGAGPGAGTCWAGK